MQVELSRRSKQKMDSFFRDIKGLGNKTLYRALNETSKKTQTQVSKDIRAEYNLPAKYVKKKMRIIKGNFTNLKFVLRLADTPTGLTSFTGTKAMKSGGVKVKVKRQGKAFLLPHAYVSRGKLDKNSVSDGNMHVFQRESKGRQIGAKPFNKKFAYGKLPREYRLPVERKVGPRVTDLFSVSNPGFYAGVSRFMSKTLAERLDANVTKSLNKLR